jgi:hypothetical protein
MACTGASVPAEAMMKAAELVQVGVTIPSSILSLTQGVLGMSAYHVKMLAAGVLLACGLGGGGAAGWLANAEAQSLTPPAAAPRVSPDEKVRQLERQLEQAKLEAEEARIQAQRAEEAKRRDEARRDEAKRDVDETRGVAVQAAPVFSTAKWDYTFVPAGEMDAAKFVKYLSDRESRGWDFTGQVTLKKDGRDAATWVFRRPVKRNTGGTSNSDPLRNNIFRTPEDPSRNTAPVPDPQPRTPKPESPDTLPVPKTPKPRVDPRRPDTAPVPEQPGSPPRPETPRR